MFDELKFQTSLGSDNHSGVHPEIMQAIIAANRGFAHAYGMDEVSALTASEFRRVFGDEVEAQYVFTGTAANVLCLKPLMQSFEAVICSEVAHLHLDEAAAPEQFLGGKLWTLPSSDGKIYPAQAKDLLQRRGDQHFAQPRCISLTLPTELGVCYSLEELKAWREFARTHNLFLHLDGARLANAAAFLKITMRELIAAASPDVVSFGGTKNGLLGAEAALLFSDEAKKNFKYHRKQAMQLSSKTRFLAAQFYAYLKDDLWLNMAVQATAHARALDQRLKNEFKEVTVAFPVQSNALFVHLPKAWIKPLRENFFFYIWDQPTNLCRWMISWDWSEAQTEALILKLKEVKSCFPAE